MMSMGHSYRVMDQEKRHLFTVQGNVKQNLMGNLVGGMLGGGGNSYLERVAARSGSMTYSVVHPSGAVVGTITKEGGPNHSLFTLMDAASQPRVTIRLERGMMGGITATAVAPNGQPILQTSGNLARHNFLIKDSAGTDVVKVHEAWAAVRDTYNIDLLGNVDPLYPLVFSILIDFEKVK